MRKFIHIAVTSLICVVYALIVIGVFAFIGTTGMKKEYYVFFCFITAMMMFSLSDYFHQMADRIFNPRIEYKSYESLADHVIGIRTLENFLEEGFEYLLSMLRIDEAEIFLLNKNTEEFISYHRRDGKTVVNDIVQVDSDSAIVKVMTSPDDLIIRKRINPLLGIDASIIESMKMLKSSAIVPIYFQKIFLGFIVIIENTRNYSFDEITSLKLIAAKIGSLHANSFFVKELFRKRELEREKETALRVRRSFYPKQEIRNSSCDVSVIARTPNMISDLFYDLHKENELIIFSAYSSGREGYDTLVFMPAIKVLIQTFVRLGFRIDRAIRRTVGLLNERSLLDSNFKMIAGTVKGNLVEYQTGTLPIPLLYSSGRRGVAESPYSMHSGDIMIFAGRELMQFMELKYAKIDEIVSDGKGKRSRHIAENIIELARHSHGLEKRLVIVIQCM